MKKNSYYATIILVIVIMLQVFTMLFYMDLKVGYHMDELWSYALPCSINENALTYLCLNSNHETPEHENISYNMWLTGEDYKDYLSISKNETFDYAKAYMNQATFDMHPPLYSYAIQSICSIFSGSFSKWYGLCINIFSFILCQILLFFIGKSLFNSNILALICCMLYGFSPVAIDTNLCIRMYSLATLIYLSSIFCLIKILEQPQQLKNYICFYLSILIGGLTQYHSLIFSFYLTLISIIICGIKKQWSIFWKIGLSSLFAVISCMLCFPYMLNHLLYSPRGTETISSLSLSEGVFSKLGIFSYYMAKYVFGASEQLSAFLEKSELYIIIICCLYLLWLLKGISIDDTTNKNLLTIIAITILCYISTISITVNTQLMGIFSGRYFFAIFPLTTLLLLAVSHYIYKKITFALKHSMLYFIIFSLYLSFHFTQNYGNLLYLFPENGYRSFLEKTLPDSICVLFAQNEEMIHSLSKDFFLCKAVFPVAMWRNPIALPNMEQLASYPKSFVLIPNLDFSHRFSENIEKQTNVKLRKIGTGITHLRSEFSLYRITTR